LKTVWNLEELQCGTARHSNGNLDSTHHHSDKRQFAKDPHKSKTSSESTTQTTSLPNTMTVTPWKDSNLALIGSDLDHKIKEAAAGQEDAWKDIDDSAGLYVWRMEQFRVVQWNKIGSFHTGDSYLILNAYLENDALRYDLHMWIGRASSQDEYGTAAYKMVECDEYLQGAAIQHRQVQGHESDAFLSLFDGPLHYLEGGVASGFNHVEPSVETPHLYQIKGTEKGMRLTQCPALTFGALNTGDSFILYANEETVTVWHGASANPDEKHRANALGETMCTRDTVTVYEQGEEPADFLEGSPDDIGEVDLDDETVQNAPPKLYQVLPDKSVEFVQEDNLSPSLLDDSNVYVIDNTFEVFLWLGSTAERNEKVAAWGAAEHYVQTMGAATHVPITCCPAQATSSPALQAVLCG